MAAILPSEIIKIEDKTVVGINTFDALTGLALINSLIDRYNSTRVDIYYQAAMLAAFSYVDRPENKHEFALCLVHAHPQILEMLNKIRQN